MKKISEDLYMYKGIYVKKLSSGNYVAHFYVNSIGGICRVIGATQASFKKIFNNFIKDNKGLNIAMTDEYQERNF